MAKAKKKISERFVHLEGAGVVRIIGAIDFFALGEEERKFVSGLIDLCNEYEQKRRAACEAAARAAKPEGSEP